MGEENDEKKLQEDLRLKNDATKTRFFLSLGISYDTCGRRKSPEEGLGGGGGRWGGSRWSCDEGKGNEERESAHSRIHIYFIFCLRFLHDNTIVPTSYQFGHKVMANVLWQFRKTVACFEIWVRSKITTQDKFRNTMVPTFCQLTNIALWRQETVCLENDGIYLQSYDGVYSTFRAKTGGLIFVILISFPKLQFSYLT